MNHGASTALLDTAPGAPARAGDETSRFVALVTDVTLVGYIATFAFEAAIRYGLNLVGLDEAIFLRDVALVLCLSCLGAEALLRGRGLAPFVLFALAMAVHGMVAVATMQSILPALYGVKVFLTFLLGLVAWSRLVQPNRFVRLGFALLLAATFVGVALDKLVLDFPWVGATVVIGNVEMEIGREWWTEDERAGGFARSSIEIAQLAPLLTLVVIGYARSFVLRALMLAAAMLMIYWTTQKGAMLAFALVAPWLLLPPATAGRFLQGVVLTSFLLMAALPLVLPGYVMPSAAGVFSPMSFYMRVEEVWPDAWRWIESHGSPILGVGLGSIGGAQRFFSPGSFNPADNMLLFFYSWFGLLGVLYLLAPVVLAFLRPTARSVGDLTEWALLAFIFGYGIVLTVVESQMGSLFLGVAVGALAARARAPERRLDPYDLGAPDDPIARFHADATPRRDVWRTAEPRRAPAALRREMRHVR